MASLRLRGFLNGFSIRNANRNKLDIDISLFLQTIEQHINLHISHSENNKLMGFIIAN